jgi:7,8-dihydroneopterin aldolase/epimerase/oxygenase
MGRKMDKIEIKGIKIYGYHGVMEEEKKLGQNFIVDLKIYKDLKMAGETDSIENTVSYAEIYDSVKQIIKKEKYDLIERLAEKIAEEVLTKFAIDKIKVRVKKPNAPIYGNFKYVGVEIKRKRV